MAKKKQSKKIKKNSQPQLSKTKVARVAKETRKSGTQQFPGFWSSPMFYVAFLFFAVCLYFMTFNYGFILDDQVFYSKNNYVIQGFSGIGKIFSEEAMSGYFDGQQDLVTGARYRPLSMVTFALEHQFFGLKPGLSHVVNALLYGITAMLIFYVCRLFWPNEDERPWYMKIGFWAALIFLAHPIHTEVVANIKGRDEVMALLFSLWTLIAAFKGRTLLHYVGVGFLFYLSLLAKENSLTFLAVIPAALYVFRQFKVEKKEWLYLFASLVIATIVYLLQRYMVIGYFLSSGKEITELLNNPFIDMNGSEKFATIFYTLLKYIQLLIWPHPLSHDYYPYAIATRNWSDIASIASLLLYAGAGIFAAIKLPRRNNYAFLIFTFIATLSIVSNIPFTVGTTMNERFVYMSSLAFVVAVPYLFISGLDKRKIPWPKIGVGIMATMVVFYSVLTVLRIPVWSDSLALNESAVAAYPNSARSNLFLGTALFNQAEASSDYNEKKALLERSRTHIQKSLDVHPIYGNGLKMKAGVAAKLYQMDNNSDELFRVFTEVLLVKPGTRYVHEYLEYMNGRGRAVQPLLEFYYKIGFEEFGQKRNMHRWAEKFLQYGYALDPTDRRILRSLALTYDSLGMTNQANQYRAQLN